MPNWCTNNLEMQGTKKDITAVKKFVEGKDTLLDFEKIAPMPKAKALLNISVPQHSEREKKIAKQNKKKYGFTDWHEFSVNMWGTKWNAYDVEGDTNNFYFLTACSPPLQVVVTLSEKFPKVNFIIAYAEEGMQFVGSVEVKNGKVIEDCDYKWNGKQGKKLRSELLGYAERIFT